MSIVLKNKINKIKKELENKIGKEEYSRFIIKTKDGLFLFEANKRVVSSKDKYTFVEKEIPGLKIYDCSECNLEDILIVADGMEEPVFILDDIPFAERIAEGYLNNSKQPYKNFTNGELKEIVGYCEINK